VLFFYWSINKSYNLNKKKPVKTTTGPECTHNYLTLQRNDPVTYQTKMDTLSNTNKENDRCHSYFLKSTNSAIKAATSNMSSATTTKRKPNNNNNNDELMLMTPPPSRSSDYTFSSSSSKRVKLSPPILQPQSQLSQEERCEYVVDCVDCYGSSSLSLPSLNATNDLQQRDDNGDGLRLRLKRRTKSEPLGSFFVHNGRVGLLLRQSTGTTKHQGLLPIRLQPGSPTSVLITSSQRKRSLSAPEELEGNGGPVHYGFQGKVELE
jgi:hypothetical protein